LMMRTGRSFWNWKSNSLRQGSQTRRGTEQSASTNPRCNRMEVLMRFAYQRIRACLLQYNRRADRRIRQRRMALYFLRFHGDRCRRDEQAPKQNPRSLCMPVSTHLRFSSELQLKSKMIKGSRL
jgi:hypothetical protein